MHSNRERIEQQRKYAKEVGAERAKEKAARKKDALAAVDQWRKDSNAKVNTTVQLTIIVVYEISDHSHSVSVCSGQCILYGMFASTERLCYEAQI
jgi:hypothetical protein